ncbi:MAG: MopE-related protein [Myxococcota bacterium]|nr:MopE-related protein [Myxococcota bacterium]
MLLLLGCLTSPGEYQDLLAKSKDFDGDGYDAVEHGGLDCDDEDPTVGPQFDEYCDGKDNDCDADVDEDAADGLSWYRDWDEDGFGEDAEEVFSCEAPEDYVDEPGDCDDRDPAIHPDAPEICDGGVDNNCNGLADDEDQVDLSSGSTWYLDEDGDGWGTESLQACEVPEGYATKDGDCDDTLRKVNPGKTEVCGDGLDNDCSGGAPECGIVGEYKFSTADHVLWGGSHGDLFGMSVAVVEATGEIIVGAPGDDLQAEDAGRLEGFSNTTMSSGSQDWNLFFAESGQRGGGMLFDLGDLTGDGVPEVLAGGLDTYDTSGVASLMSFNGTKWTEEAVLQGAQDTFGIAAAGLPATGNGGVGLAIGDPMYLYGIGAVHVWLDLPAGNQGVSDADIRILGEDDDQQLGQINSLTSGDWDGDGVTALFMGTGLGEGFVDAPSTWTTGDRLVSDTQTRVRSGEEDSMLGVGAATGDINGDGYPDLVLSAPMHDTSVHADVGVVFVFSGSPSPWGPSVGTGDAATTIVGDFDGSGFGFGLALGDADGDGTDDVAASYGSSALRRSYVAVFTAIPSGEVDFAQATATIEGQGDEPCGQFRSVHLGDLNGDDMEDLVLGCPEASEDVWADELGAVSVFLTQGL